MLADAGAEALIIETMMDMKEALCAVRACKNKTQLPVIVSLTFVTPKDGGRTQMGDRASACAAEFQKSGADIIGANCGALAPEQMAVIVKSYWESAKLPVLAQPNAGKPRLDGDNTVFDMTLDDFARGAMECVRAGARLIGGCCGTSPAHIRALARAAAAL